MCKHKSSHRHCQKHRRYLLHKFISNLELSDKSPSLSMRELIDYIQSKYTDKKPLYRQGVFDFEDESSSIATIQPARPMQGERQ